MNAHDADDACQATFVVLARKAEKLQIDNLPGYRIKAWLLP